MPGKHRQWSNEQLRWLHPGEPGYDEGVPAAELSIDESAVPVNRKPLKFPVRIGSERLMCDMSEEGYIEIPLEFASRATYSDTPSMSITQGQFSFVELLKASGVTPAEAQKALTRYKKEWRENQSVGASSHDGQSDHQGENMEGGDDNADQREVQGESGDRAVPDHG